MSMTSIVFYCLLLSSGMSDPRLLRHDWSVITKSRGAHINVIRNLTLRDALLVDRKVDPNPYPLTRPELKTSQSLMFSTAATSGTIHFVSEGDIDDVWIIGPDGWQEGCMWAWSCK